jgi:hypothetical protein
MRCHSVATKPFWSLDHVFAYDTFVMTGGSIVNTQQEFRRHFNIGRHGDIPTPKNHTAMGYIVKIYQYTDE